LSGTIISGVAVFAKMGLSMYEISVFRAVFALFLFLYLLYIKDYALSKKMLKMYILFGLIVATATILEFAPILLGVPVAITVLLLYTAPLWTVVLSKFFFQEEITKVKWLAIILVLVGITVLVNPLTIKQGTSLVGLLMALAGGVGLALWGVYGKICGNENAHPVKTQFYEAFFEIIFLAIFYPILGLFIKDSNLIGFSFAQTPMIWVYLLGFSIVSYIIPHFFYFIGVKEIPASTAGIILLLEPFAGAILAALFLAQAITVNVFIGGLFILFANYLVIKSESNHDTVAKELLA
jgi:drug/metabolite transporter (DMT)-like permease